MTVGTLSAAPRRKKSGDTNREKRIFSATHTSACVTLTHTH